MNNSLTDVPGLKVGHWTRLDAATGCTVVLVPQGAVAGADVRGSAPATRETDLLEPVRLIQQVHAVVLSGGSAFGLAAADGVMRWLEERGHGFDTTVARVPIVPAACIFDLGLGRSDVRPDAAAGYAACQAATSGAVPQGNVGAGTGATVGKGRGIGRAMKGGLGCASRLLDGGVIAAAMAVVNAFGDVIDSTDGHVIAGAREGSESDDEPGAGRMDAALTNTTLAVVATDAALSKTAATKVAQMAQDGLARVLRPAHTLFDGDAIFALSLGEKPADLNQLGAAAADLVVEAVLAGVRAAESLHGVPAAGDRNK